MTHTPAPSSWLELENKVCVVTGAASGIGAEIARELASVGARVALLDRDVQGATKVAATIESGGRAIAVGCDITLQDSVAEAAATVERELGRCDLRWKNKVISVVQTDDEVTATVETPAGRYRLTADWLVDATGVNSGIRQGFGLDPHTSRIADRWPNCAAWRSTRLR